MAENIIINDSLLNSTIGTKVGGTITSDGYKPGVGSSHILYQNNVQIQNGRIEFEIKGFDPNNLKDYDFINNSTGTNGADGIPDKAADSGFFGMYDGRGITEPCAYYSDFRNNFFRWNFHWRQNRNVFKAVVACMAPIDENLNATKAVCPNAANGSIARNWGVEPNGITFTFDQSTWYKVIAEWNNKKFTISVNNTIVWSAYGIYDYLPVSHRIWLGSAPGSNDKYVNSSSTIIYRNFKLIKYDDTIVETYLPSTKTKLTKNNNKLLINNKISKISGDSLTQFHQWSGYNFNYKKYVDDLKANNSNAILYWSFMGFPGEEFSDKRYQTGYVPPTLWPWIQYGGLYNLEKFNQAYFDLLNRFISYAGENGIIFVLTIFDGWTKDNLLGHPFYSVNGGPIPNTKKTDDTYDVQTDRHKFIDLYDYNSEITVKPTDNDYKKLNQWYLEKYVQKLIQEIGNNTNIIFEIFNEGEWYNNSENHALFQKHFAKFIKDRTQLLVMCEYDSIVTSNKQTYILNNDNVDMLSFHQPFLYQDSGKYYTSSINYFDDYLSKQSLNTNKPTFFSETVKAFDPKYNPGVTEKTVMRAIWGTLLGGGNITVQNDTSLIYDSINTVYKSYSTQKSNIHRMEGVASNFFNNVIGSLDQLTSNKNISSTGIAMYELNNKYIVYSENQNDITINNISGSFNYIILNPYTGEQSTENTFVATSTYKLTNTFPIDSVIYIKNNKLQQQYLNVISSVYLNNDNNFTYNLQIESNVNWNINNIPNWLNFSIINGNNNANINITINSSFITSNNMSYDIIISSDYVTDKIVTINYNNISDTVEWTNNGLKVLGNALIDSNINNVISSCILTNKITLEVWVNPMLLSTTSLCKIAVIGDNNNKINILLGQIGTEYCVYIRTNNTDEYGINTIQTKGGIVKNQLQHVVFTYNNGSRKLYVDNILVSNITDSITGITNWNSLYKLYLSNVEVVDTNTEWIGTYKLLSIYDRDLLQDEITQNYIAGGGVVVIGNAPSIISQTTGNILLFIGSELDISITVTGTFPINYQWYKDNEILQNENTNRLYILSTNLQNSGIYKCVASNGILPDAISSDIIVTIIDNTDIPIITKQPKNQNISVDDTTGESEVATFTVEAKATSDSNIKYQWYKNNNILLNETNNIFIKRASVPSDDGTKYKVAVSNEFGSDISEEAVLSVYTITNDLLPVSFTNIKSSNKSVLIEWTEPNTDKEVFYEIWYSNSGLNGEYFKMTDITQNNVNTYIDSNFNEYGITRWYYFNTYNKTLSMLSRKSEKISATTAFIEQLIILSQPQNATVDSGLSVTFYVSVNLTDVIYKWYKNDIEISNSNSNNYTINNVTINDNNSSYYCIITKESQSIISNRVVLTVNEVVELPIIIEQPIDVNIKYGSDATFLVSSSNTDSYQWQEFYSGSWNNLNNQINNTLIFIKPEPTVSSSVIIPIEPPTIITQPTDINIKYGSDATFIISSSNTDSYQWQEFYSGSWNNLNNQNNNILVFIKPEPTVSSSVIIPIELPIIITQPTDINIKYGSDAIFSILSNNTDSYQWQEFYSGSWNSLNNQINNTLVFIKPNVTKV